MGLISQDDLPARRPGDRALSRAGLSQITVKSDLTHSHIFKNAVDDFCFQDEQYMRERDR